MYVVCSLEKEEGEEIIIKFLKLNPNFEIVNLKQMNLDLKFNTRFSNNGFIRLLPTDFKVDKNELNILNGNNGFFSTIIERKF